MTPQRSHSIHAADPAPAMLASLSTDSTRSCAVPGLEPFMRPIAITLMLISAFLPA